MTKQRRKFKLKDVWYPLNLTLTEARKMVGNSSLNDLEVGHSITFSGMNGNASNFTIQRIQ